MFRFILLLSIFLCSVSVFAAMYMDEVEKDFGLKSIGQLRIVNPKGDVSVQSWALDKIRIKFVKRVESESSEKAKELLNRIDYRSVFAAGNVEISSHYGKDLPLKDRLRADDQRKIRTDMVVYAPAHLSLSVWSVEGVVTIKGWRSNLELRLSSGAVTLEGIKAKKISLTCPLCDLSLKSIQASVKCVGGEGAIHLNQVKGGSIYVESESGPMTLLDISGEQLYSSGSAQVAGRHLAGRVEFHSKKGNIDFRGLSGFLSGSSESGSIHAQVQDWVPLDKGFLETTTGSISLVFSNSFSADVDIWSLSGNVKVDFPIINADDARIFGPRSLSHLTGKINSGGELIRITSDSGDIHLTRAVN